MAKTDPILCTKCQEIFHGINYLSHHLSNCYKEIKFTYDKKCNKLNIIKDKTRIVLFKLPQYITNQCTCKTQTFEPVLNLFVIHQREKLINNPM